MRHLVIYLCAIALAPFTAALNFGAKRRPTISTSQTRRDLLLLVGASSAGLIGTAPAFADDDESSTASSPPTVTAIATLDISIARGPPAPLRIELFGTAAPASVELFTALASNTLKAQCPVDNNGNNNVLDIVIEDCQEYESIAVGFKGSQLWRLVPNKRLDFGRVDSMFAARIPPGIEREEEAGIIKASARGAVSIKRGGGAFEFTIAPAYNPSLEKEDLVVVGRVAESDLAFLDAINEVPSRRDIVSIADVPPLGSKFARACDFTAPDSSCAQFKPIKKVVVKDSRVDLVR